MSRLLINTALIGNILFVLWITWNGVDEGFKGTPYQIASYIGLVLLLVLNCILLYRHRRG